MFTELRIVFELLSLLSMEDLLVSANLMLVESVLTCQGWSSVLFFLEGFLWEIWAYLVDFTGDIELSQSLYLGLWLRWVTCLGSDLLAVDFIFLLLDSLSHGVGV